MRAAIDAVFFFNTPLASPQQFISVYYNKLIKIKIRMIILNNHCTLMIKAQFFNKLTTQLVQE